MVPHPVDLWARSSGMATKHAARRGLEIIRNLVRSGAPEKLTKANTLAKTPGVLKPSIAGSQLRDLGQGSEGVATLVAHPEHGISVRKLYDPQGVASPEMIQRKHLAGVQLGKEPSIAHHYAESATPRGGGKIHHNEFVPDGGKISLDQADAVEQQASSAIVKKTPFDMPLDIRQGNMVMDARTNKPRVVDFMPMREGEIAIGSPGHNAITPTPQARGLFNPNMRDFALGQGLPKEVASRVGSQQSAHLKQTFLGRKAVTTPAVTQSSQIKMLSEHGQKLPKSPKTAVLP